MHIKILLSHIVLIHGSTNIMAVDNFFGKTQINAQNQTLKAIKNSNRSQKKR